MKNGSIDWLDLSCTLDLLMPSRHVDEMDPALSKLLIDLETQPKHVVQSYAHMLPMHGEKVDKDSRFENDAVCWYQRSIAWTLENLSHQRPGTEVNISDEKTGGGSSRMFFLSRFCANHSLLRMQN